MGKVISTHHKNWKDNMEEIKYRLNGIPCLIRVVSYSVAKPITSNPWMAGTPEDLYGSVEIEYEILDRKGYYAKWLVEKITDEIDADIINAIIEKYKNVEPGDF